MEMASYLISSYRGVLKDLKFDISFQALFSSSGFLNPYYVYCEVLIPVLNANIKSKLE